jgi:hyaluronan synthase/N-acetylglucosaminyltransferase
VTAIGVHMLEQALVVVFLVYTALTLGHFVLQTVFAHRAFRQSGRLAAADAALGPYTPSVDVIVPCYNERADHLEACLASLAGQDYDGRIAVYVVDDGSPNREEILPVLERYGALPGWHVVLPDRNAGKRHAQAEAFGLGDGELVVTIDSDTEVDPDGIAEIVRAFRDERVGAVTGDVGVSNAGENLLTRLIALRYWVAFNQERAAQGWFGAVLCCSGPFSVYRRSALAGVWRRYLEQTFQGVRCTFGDDRHLTNLVLGDGYLTRFEPRARCITHAPTSVREYLRQQLRWNKSFYRELLWTFPFLSTRPWYLTFEIVTQVLLPFLLTLAVGATIVYAAVDHEPRRLAVYAATVAIMAVLRCAYAMWRTRDPRFLLFVLYGFLHAGLLIPVRVRALSTLTDNRWGTRLVARAKGAPAPGPAA